MYVALLMYAARFIGNVNFHVSLEVVSKFKQLNLTSIISRRARRTTLETSSLTRCRSPSINTGTSTQSLFSTNGSRTTWWRGLTGRPRRSYRSHNQFRCARSLEHSNVCVCVRFCVSVGGYGSVCPWCHKWVFSRLSFSRYGCAWMCMDVCVSVCVCIYIIDL